MKIFRARETAWLTELDGIELADFWQRALAFAIDLLLALLMTMVILFAAAMCVSGWLALHGHPQRYNLQLHLDSEVDKLLLELLALVLYFGVSTYLGKGRSPGKRLLKIRVVSLVHRHLSLWHCVERALGYAAAALEFGFGFLQFFIHPYRRTVQDRIAETIVVKEESFRLLVLTKPAEAVAVPAVAEDQPPQETAAGPTAAE